MQKSSISAPYKIDKEIILVGASCGVAFFPKDGDSVDELLSAADHKMYVEKQFCKLQSI